MSVKKEARQELEAQLAEAVRAFQRATDEIDELVAHRLGINRTDARCLDILEERGRISAGELAQAAGLTTGAVTGVVDRLERRGLVERVRDTEDRRRVFVATTPRTRELVGQYYGPLAERGAELMRTFDDRELAVMVRYLREGVELMRAHAERLRAEAG